jgi:quercetin dioxygenase-like cupin family protein
MRVTRGTTTTAGPTEWFTGTVHMEAVTTASGESRINASNVHFTPGARTAWHAHPNGQTIYVTDGVGLAQGRGGPIEVIRPGNRVFFAPNEDHWHGAAPTRFITHLSLVEVEGQANSATWGAHVTDEEYVAAPSIE